MSTDTGYRLHRHADLRALNTLRVSATAERLFEVTDVRSLPALLDLPEVARAPVHVLGEGSNVLVTGDIAGSLLRLMPRAVQVLALDADTARVRVEAGHSWHALVLHTLDLGFAGLENLALIPGTVGAAPIQNIGAYGVEVAERILAVEAFDRRQDAFRVLSRAQCGFGYRDSLFKRDPDRFIVTAVTFEIRRHDQPQLDYQGIRAELDAVGVTEPHARDVAGAVIRLRQRKLPDPAEIPNAGSFFKNPVVDGARLERLLAEFPDMPHWPAAHGHKLSAGWLIEQAGLKGARSGDAGMSSRHALVLVNHGSATGGQLRDFAMHVQDRVQACFGVLLEPEPVYW